MVSLFSEIHFGLKMINLIWKEAVSEGKPFRVTGVGSFSFNNLLLKK